MAKFGNFNYNPEGSIEEILRQYKDYRKKDLKGMVKQEELDTVKTQLQQLSDKEKNLISQNSTKMFDKVAKTVLGDKFDKLQKAGLLTQPKDFDPFAENAEKVMTDHIMAVKEAVVDTATGIAGNTPDVQTQTPSTPIPSGEDMNGL